MALRVYRSTADESSFEHMKRCESERESHVFGEDERFVKPNGEVVKYRLYYACDDLVSYFDRLRSFPPMMRRAHEMFNPNMRCRLFMDVDCVGESKQKVLDNVAMVMTKLGSTRYVVVDGTSDVKVSFHVIAHDVVVGNADAVRRYIVSVLESNDLDASALGIDLNPCGCWKSIRTLYSKGFDKTVWLRIMGKSTEDVSYFDFESATIQTRDAITTDVPETLGSIVLAPYDDTMESLKCRAVDTIHNWLLMRFEDAKIKRATSFESQNSVSMYVQNMPCPFLRDHVHHSNRTMISCTLFDPALLASEELVHAPSVRIVMGCLNVKCGENREKRELEPSEIRWIQSKIYG